MNNLPLPHIPVQQIFYYRQLWVNCFFTYNLKTKQKENIHHEVLAKIGAKTMLLWRQVCLLLYDYIQQYIPETEEKKHIFSNGYTGQNQNYTVFWFLLTLSAGKGVTVTRYFLVRGHSFLPCGRIFGVIKRRNRKDNRIKSIRRLHNTGI